MLSIVWAWVNVAWFASAFDTDDWLYRALTLVQMGGVLVLAIGLPPVFASIEHGDALDNGIAVAGYVIIRLALVAQWLRAIQPNPDLRRTAATYGIWVGAAQVGWIVLALVHAPVAIGLAVALGLLLVEVLGPVLAERRGSVRDAATPWHPHHLAERFSLLTIIALGETVFGTLVSATEITTDSGWTADVVALIGVGVALSFALWWTYFLVPHALALEARRSRVLPWAYGHVFLFTAIAAVGAGLHLIAYDVSVAAVVITVAVPVSVFLVVRYLLQVWLVSATPGAIGLHVGAVLLPLAAIVLAVVGAPLWLCLVVVLAGPVSIVVAFEVGGWRGLEKQLARSLDGRSAGPTAVR